MSKRHTGIGDRTPLEAAWSAPKTRPDASPIKPEVAVAELAIGAVIAATAVVAGAAIARRVTQRV